MKRVLIALFLMLPMMILAQETKSYTFDFSKPDELNPPIDKSQLEYVGDEIPLNNIVFYSDDRAVCIRFNPNDGRGAVETRGYNDSIFYYPMQYDSDGRRVAKEVIEDYFLYVARGSQYIFEATGNAELVSIKFLNNTKIGNSRVESPTDKGRSDGRGDWYSDGASGITQVVYQMHGQMPEFRGITVSYKSNAKIEFLPTNVNPVNGTEFLKETFSAYTLTFSENIELATGAKFTLSGPAGFQAIELEPSIKNNTLTLSLPTGKKVDIVGDYTLTVPAESIKYAEQWGTNKAYTCTFKVIDKNSDPDTPYNPDQPENPDNPDQPDQPVNPTEVLELVSITPASGTKVEAIPNGATVENSIVVKFGANISNNFGTEKARVENYLGETLCTAQFMWTDVNTETFQTQSIRLKFDAAAGYEELPVIKADGRYVVVIPAGVIFSSDRKAANEEIRINYTIGDLKFLTEAQLAQIDETLAITGVGYPAEDSPSRKALENMRKAELGTQEDVDNAIAAFYSESSVTLPENGKYYIITAVNVEKKELYVQYVSEKFVIVTDNKDDATHFQAVRNANGTVSFKTPDGKFITQMYKGEDNFTEGNTDKNGLTLKHLELEGKAPELLFGLFSINTLETDADDVTHPIYTLVNYNNIAFETSVLNPLKYFDSARTNAFRFDETTKPEDQQPSQVVVVAGISSPADGASVETLNNVILAFSNADKATIAYNSSKDIVLKNTTTSVVYKAQVKLEGGTATLTFSGVTAGTYTLTVPEGAFTYTVNGTTQNVAAVSATYTVKESGTNPTVVTAVVSPASGSTVDALNNISVSFNGSSGLTVVYNSSSSIKLTGVDNTRTYTASVSANGTNKYNLTFGNVVAGSYRLSIPVGTFTYTQNGQMYNVAAVSAEYTVKEQEQDLTGFGDFNNKYFDELFVIGGNASEYKFSSDLGMFMIVIKKEHFPFVLTGRVVKVYNDENWVADGHFEVIDYNESNYGKCTALSLVIDRSVPLNSIASGEYYYHVQAGTYGDGNYGKYLDNPSSVAKSDCYVNSSTVYISSIYNKNDFAATLKEVKDVVKDDLDNMDYIRNNVNYENAVAVDLLHSLEDALVVLQNAIPVAESLMNDPNADAQAMGTMQNQFKSVILNMNFVRSLVLMQTSPHYANQYVMALNNAVNSLRATGIEGVNTKQRYVAGEIYDLSGRRINGKPQGGFYIINGKKVLVL